MAKTREIPRERWVDYLEALSESARDRPVRIEVSGRALGSQPIERHAPLLDLELNEKGSSRGAIELAVGWDGTLHGHRVACPEHLYSQENDAGEVEALDIEDDEHVKTLVVFERPMLLPA